MGEKLASFIAPLAPRGTREIRTGGAGLHVREEELGIGAASVRALVLGKTTVLI